MWEKEELPPGLLEALAALTNGEDLPEEAVIFVIRPDPRDQLMEAFNEGLEEGHRFYDVLGGDLLSAEAVIDALKADGRVQVTQTVELDPLLAGYL